MKVMRRTFPVQLNQLPILETSEVILKKLDKNILSPQFNYNMKKLVRLHPFPPARSTKYC